MELGPSHHGPSGAAATDLRSFRPFPADGRVASWRRSFWSPAVGLVEKRDAVSIEFLVTSLIVVATPGTGVLYTLAAGLSRGMRASIVAAFGCTLGIIPHMAAAILGLAALLHASALAFQTLKYLGVVYLLYMAWNTLREQGALTVETDVDPRSTRQVIVSAILTKASM
jgi:threonine/homoserine/homoserine lactone efflux protein